MTGLPTSRLVGVGALVAVLLAAAVMTTCSVRGDDRSSSTTSPDRISAGPDSSSTSRSTPPDPTTGAATSTSSAGGSATATTARPSNGAGAGAEDPGDGTAGGGSRPVPPTDGSTDRGPTDTQPSSPTTTPPRTGRIPAGSWQYQLTGALDLSVDAAIWDVDGDETTAAQVTALHRRGAYVICYLSAGSFEDWRSDAGRYPASVLGRPLDGWPGERWVDVRRTDVLLPILRDRIARCRAKGFDAVEFDNVDGYANDTGFPLTSADQLRFNRALAGAAHAQGMHAALKNDADQVAALVGSFDLAVVEECVRYDECDRYRPFTAAGKPVLVVEYDVAVDVVCARTRPLGFRAIVKDLDLGPGRRTC